MRRFPSAYGLLLNKIQLNVEKPTSSVLSVLLLIYENYLFAKIWTWQVVKVSAGVLFDRAGREKRQGEKERRDKHLTRKLEMTLIYAKWTFEGED